MTAGGIATPHGAATDAGELALREGGNALDAAITACAVLAVTYPHMCAVGGDVIALVAHPEGGATVVNGSGPAPQGIPVEALREGAGEMPITGPHTITVPGAVAAWEELRGLGARFGLAELLAPAIEFAERGVPVAPSLARSLEDEAESLFADPGMRAVLATEGKPLTTGDLLRQPQLAESLRAIAEQGPAALYGGPVGAVLVSGLGELGCTLALSDLAAFAPERTEPLRRELLGFEVLTAPPNSQGLLLLEALGALERIEPDPAALARLFRLISIDRDRYLADPRRAEVPVAELLGEAHTEELVAVATSASPLPSPEPVARPSGDTVAVTAVDEEGRAVTVIQSVFHSFGAGILEPETGIICHNRGASFTLRAGSPNALEPGKRPAHTLMPVVLRDGDTLIAQGTMGGRAQPQIHAQLVLARRAGEDAQAAAAAPRFVVGGLDQGTPDEVVMAEASLPAETRERLGASGMEVVELSPDSEEVGHVQIAAIGPDGFEAGTDPRADGKATVVL